MKAFCYNGVNYIRVIPGKRLFNSTMIHEVVNRGDIFGMEIGTQVMTIIPGGAKVEHFELYIYEPSLPSRGEDVVDKLKEMLL